MTPPVRDDVAITGLSCLFPGAPDVDAYWQNILRKVDAVSDPPPEAWDPEAYYDQTFADTDKVYCKRGGYLGALASFDPLAHGIPPVSVGGEPDQWLALALAEDALADAGCDDLPADVRARTGIVLGKGTYLNAGNAVAVQRSLIIDQTVEVVRRLHPEHSDEQLGRLRQAIKEALPPISAETVPGLIPNIIVGRIANRLDLMGPTYTVDAACASSLVAVQRAVRHLIDGECDLALAGGSQVWMPVPTLNLFCKLGALSRREQIRPFDKDADGTLLGEGIGMVVLKRAADARRDGDRVYALIKGVGVASDGRGMSVMAPRVDGEELALRRGYEEAGVSPRSVGLVEAHGTGTPVGDVVELQALTRVFGAREEALPRCALGTVKSMISHTIPAAGIAGLIKVALALHQRVLPPTLHCEEPNPKLELEKTPFYLNTETRPWIHGGSGPRRAGINAFGFGGINAHAVLEEVPGTASPDHLPTWDSEICVLEAGSPAELAQRARLLAEALDPPPTYALADLAYTLSLQLGRTPGGLRLAIVASSFAELARKLATATGRLEKPGTRQIKDVSGIYYAAEPLGRDGRVVLVFPGEGAQYPDMLADLCLHFPEVREAFDQVARIYSGHPRGHLSSDWIFPRPALTDEERRLAGERLMQMDIAVEAVLAGNAAMHALLQRLGLRGDACVGHSTGELSAASAAGVLSIDDEERRAEFSRGLYDCYAGAAARDDVPRAVLLAVGAERAQVEAVAREAGGDLLVAMDNCPHQAVLAGEPQAAKRARRILEREGLIHEQLPYDRAVHTPRFAPFAAALRDVFAAVPIGTAHTALYSCTTSERYPDDPAAVRELLVEHWTSPVEFRRTIERLYDAGARVFVECGPRGNLSAFIEDILRGRECCAVPADVQRRTGLTQLNHLVGRLVAHDVALDVSELYASRKVREVAWEQPSRAEDRRATVSLGSGWPMLRLPEAAVEEIRGSAPSSPAEHAPAAEFLAVTAFDSDALDPVFDAHLSTMHRFLTAEQDVMEAFLQPGPPVIHPLLGSVVSWLPGVELITRRDVDVADDLYLQDHRLGGTLAVMPLAMSLAVMAQAAADLVPGRSVVGLRDVRASRWLAVPDDDPQAVEIYARALPEQDATARVRVELRSLGEDAMVAQATVLVGDAYPPAPAPLEFSETRPSILEPAGLYTHAMFHGPRWRAVRAVEVSGPGGAVARLEVLPHEDFLRGGPVPALALDPIALDAAGQVIGFWTGEQLATGKVVFPFVLEALDVFSAARAAGETLRCTAATELLGEQLVRSDIDVAGADGRPWLRLTGWMDKRFDVPAPLLPLVLASDEAVMSSEWRAPAGALRSPHPLQCRRLAVTLPADGGPWARVWAQRVLSSTERDDLGRLQRPDQRCERLASRTAAKEAVRELVARHHGLDLRLDEIEIHADDRGRPIVGGDWAGAVDARPVVSLAHTEGHAVALAALGGTVGIDIEPMRQPAPGFAAAAFTDRERELLGGLPAHTADEWVLRCWCAKEALAKALGVGLSDPHDVVVTAVDAGGGRVEAGIAGALADLRPDLRGVPLTVCSLREDALIVATTVCETGGALR